MTRRIAIGCGSAYANDRLEPAVAMAESGRVTYMGFDCLAERTLALAHVRRLQDPSAGQDRRVGRVVKLLTRYLEGGKHVIGNFGAANPDAAAREVIDALRENDLAGVRVGVIHGDDVRDQVLRYDLALPELATTA